MSLAVTDETGSRNRDVTFQALKKRIPRSKSEQKKIVLFLYLEMSNENCIRKLENENLEYFEYEFCKIKEFNLKRS